MIIGFVIAYILIATFVFCFLLERTYWDGLFVTIVTLILACCRPDYSSRTDGLLACQEDPVK